MNLATRLPAWVASHVTGHPCHRCGLPLNLGCVTGLMIRHRRPDPARDGTPAFFLQVQCPRPDCQTLGLIQVQVDQQACLEAVKASWAIAAAVGSALPKLRLARE